MAYDANGAAGPHSPPDGRNAWVSENHRQRVAEEAARGEWDDMDEYVQDWLCENAANYIVALARGGDAADTARAQMRQDCVAYLVNTMDPDRIEDALDDEAGVA